MPTIVVANKNVNKALRASKDQLAIIILNFLDVKVIKIAFYSDILMRSLSHHLQHNSWKKLSKPDFEQVIQNLISSTQMPSGFCKLQHCLIVASY